MEELSVAPECRRQQNTIEAGIVTEPDGGS